MAETNVELGQCFEVGYLGSSPLSRMATGLGLLQKPLRHVYFSFQTREGPRKLRQTQLILTDRGLVVSTQPNENNFYSITSVLFWDCVQFVTVRANKGTKCAFEPLDNDHSRNMDNLFVDLDKEFSYLAKRTDHPSLFSCVLRRTAGVKSLDLHTFVCSTQEQALALVKGFNGMAERQIHEVQNSSVFAYSPFVNESRDDPLLLASRYADRFQLMKTVSASDSAHIADEIRSQSKRQDGGRSERQNGERSVRQNLMSQSVKDVSQRSNMKRPSLSYLKDDSKLVTPASLELSFYQGDINSVLPHSREYPKIEVPPAHKDSSRNVSVVRQREGINEHGCRRYEESLDTPPIPRRVDDHQSEGSIRRQDDQIVGNCPSKQKTTQELTLRSSETQFSQQCHSDVLLERSLMPRVQNALEGDRKEIPRDLNEMPLYVASSSLDVKRGLAAKPIAMVAPRRIQGIRVLPKQNCPIKPDIGRPHQSSVNLPAHVNTRQNMTHVNTRQDMTHVNTRQDMTHVSTRQDMTHVKNQELTTSNKPKELQTTCDNRAKEKHRSEREKKEDELATVAANMKLDFLEEMNTLSARATNFEEALGYFP